MKTKKFTLDPIGVLTLSLRQLISRIWYLMRVNFWGLVLTLPLVTWPAARAGVIYGVREGLLDPFEEKERPLKAVTTGFLRYFWRSMALGYLNLVALLVIAASILFWVQLENRALNYVAIIGVYALVMWWMCQPFLFPALLDNPELSLKDVFVQSIFRVVSLNPLYIVLTGMILFTLNLLAMALFGPVLLLSGALTALISVQAFWVLTGHPIPDMQHPLEIIAQQEREAAEKKAADDQA
ncbi:MAG: hypothetical protein IT326_02030 [Anaerolineae bacterium]|nr:hypothetical protein [Anaerolineae bacterium]